MLKFLTLTAVMFIGACSFKPYAKSEIKVGIDKKEQNTKLTKGVILDRKYFFKEADKDQSYTLYIPKTYNAKKKTPLIVLLHGLRSNPSQIIRYKGIVTEAEKRGYVLVAPFGYNERGWYGSRGKGKAGPAFGKANDPENLGELSEKDVMNVVKIIRSEFTIDPKRIFLLGHSMGGGGALHLAATYPHVWTGLGCLAPAFKGPYTNLAKLKHLPTLVITGDKDFLVPVKGVRRWVEEMKKLDMNIFYKEIEGGRHFGTIARNPKMIAEVFDFFDLHERKGLVKKTN